MTTAIERNRDPIKAVLQQYIVEDSSILEIGSGSGEHAVYFGKYFSKTKWVTSDQSINHEKIKQNLDKNSLENVEGPIKLKVGEDDFPPGSFDYVFTANTLHIMSWKESKTLFKLLGRRLREGCFVFIYGPFNYQGDFTSDSNKLFDQSLKQRNLKSGIRNFEDVLQNMNKVGFKLFKDHEMPANNRMLVFERLPYEK
jgi:cyclopropane fatty-acyl-phospholipid synthase-like methyltransferase